MKLFGIQISIHWTYWIMVVWFLANSILTLNVGKMIWEVIILSMLAGLLIGHELAHALTARRYGYQTSSITMHLLGGIAMINMARVKPREEFWIALAGPAFNIALGLPTLLLWAINPSQLFMISGDEGTIQTVLGYGILYFSLMNLIMGLFNLLPAYPMDGGRIIRSLLSHLDKMTVLNISNGLTLIIAAFFIVGGLSMGQLMLVILGVILIMLVWAERKKMITI